ncbi:gliding motility-associated C-terminal domain-containing protein [Flavobacterium bizetiae]|uniref:T9SS type B sorting domain-containing protein n=1 Tax=Flavobacterium bizetiae TaxID=2704140 RepID=UPI0021E847DA|nr:gliding motility-associated C-terminal domain-containing protein [Flavobacterium bizetiae]UTN02674.1 gliding motility-associated C-terminal domain-containing protein [Flavobacterium bizetiae]
MNLRITRRTHFFLILLFLFSSTVFSQCFEIQSILIDACGGTLEGRNEMVRFKIGNAPLNINTLTVIWPNNTWQGVVEDATTAAIVAQLNADIIAAGGCGQIVEPPGGILPLNATAILVTSYQMTPSANSFGPLSETIYMVFQNSINPNGHFANFGPAPGARTLTMNFVGSCSDIVVYDRTQLNDINGNKVAADGATVNFTPAGVASYTNNGCKAPVPPFTVDAGPSTLTACAGSTITLNGVAVGQQSVAWSSPSGSFSSPATTTTNYTIPSAAGGTTIALTLQATNTCGLQISDVINLSVTSNVTPDFATNLTLCNTDIAPALALTSPNGITGTWNPSIISTTTSGNYIFTPNAGQCSSATTLAVTITPEITPDFASTLTLCSTDTAPTLALTSPNGITGTWNPSIISTATSGNYIFTPNAGQCASTATLAVTITPEITPDFATTLTLCSTDTAPTLALTSPNGITGTWNPSIINTTTSGNYIFTPNTGQCATTATLAITITPKTMPNFATTLTLCNADTAPTLALTSPNGITGTWNPSIISTTTNGNYIFTPNAGQCASTTTLAVTITPKTTPDFATTLTLCSADVVPTLALTSPNGITGTWNPSIISTTTSGNYIFTPNTGQCATTTTLAVNITSLSFSISKECVDNTYLIKAVTESPSSNYNFNWLNEKGDAIGSNNDTFDFTAYSKSSNDQLVFPLQFKVIVSNGSCESEQTFEIENNLCGVPNAISPNGDGVNDTFDLTAYNVTSLKIYNRWGREVYDFRGRYDQQWHGQWKEGNRLPMGTYFYIILSDNGDQKAGWVYLAY